MPYAFISSSTKNQAAADAMREYGKISVLNGFVPQP